jgi:hypothetical protein
VSYRYSLAVDVTDEGGETRSAEKTFRLGWTTVEARVQLEEAFLVAGEPAKATVVRTNLDGVPRAGAGSYRIVALEQPSAPLLPADEQTAAGNCRQDTGTFATSPATDEPTLGDVTIAPYVRYWKQGGTADDVTDGMSFDTYLGDPLLADRVVFLPTGGILPPQDPLTSAAPTPAGGRGLYFADWNGQNFFRVTVETDLTGKIRSDKYEDGLGYVGTGWTWQ